MLLPAAPLSFLAQSRHTQDSLCHFHTGGRGESTGTKSCLLKTLPRNHLHLTLGVSRRCVWERDLLLKYVSLVCIYRFVCICVLM